MDREPVKGSVPWPRALCRVAFAVLDGFRVGGVEGGVNGPVAVVVGVVVVVVVVVSVVEIDVVIDVVFGPAVVIGATAQ